MALMVRVGRKSTNGLPVGTIKWIFMNWVGIIPDNFFCIFEKSQIMTVSDLKLKIFRQIDSLERNRLEELYGVLLNFLNEKRDISDWEGLTEEQKQGIFDAIEEIELGKGIPNEEVMTKIRKKYSHA